MPTQIFGVVWSALYHNNLNFDQFQLNNNQGMTVIDFEELKEIVWNSELRNVFYWEIAWELCVGHVQKANWSASEELKGCLII